MIKELLKKLGYADEDITKIEKGLSDEKIFLTKEENIEERYSKLKTQKEELEGQVQTLTETNTNIQTEYDNYKKGSITQEEYETKVKEIQEEADNKVKQNNFDSKLAVKLMSKEINAKDVVDIKANLDMSKISLDGENFIGLDEQINSLKERKDYLFNKEETVITGAGESGRQKVDGNKPDFSKMSYEDIAKYLEQNPDAEIE